MKISQVKVKLGNLFIIGAFLAQSVAPIAAVEPVVAGEKGARPAPVKATEVREAGSAGDLFIPENYGFIKARFKGTSGKTLLYIEDIHANREAQTNIAHIIRHARNSFAGDSLRLIAVEGAEGRIDPSLLKSCPDKTTREKIAGVLLGEGYISGAEFYAVSDDEPVLLYGIERGDLYAKNLKNFIRVQRIREKGVRYVELLRRAFEEIGEQVYPAEVKSLLHVGAEHAAGAVPFSAYAAFLHAFYLKHKDAHPEVAALYGGLRDFRTFIAASALEKKIALKNVERQRQAFIQGLSGRLDKQELADLVKQTLLYRTGKMPANEFYAYAKRRADEKNLSLAQWPDLNTYIEMVGLYARMDNDNLFEETGLLANLLKGALLMTDGQREFDRQFKNMTILEKMTSLRMTRGDLEYYYRHRDDFTQARFTAFLRSYRPQPAEHFDEYLDLVFSAITYVEEFYDTALARDDALFRNVVKKLRGEKSGFAVLITGGFHTEGVKKRLAEEGISYVVVAPRAARSADSAVYLQRMMEVSPPFARYLFTPAHLAVEVLSAVQPITGRGEKNKEYLNIKEVMLALSLMLASHDKAQGLLPDEIRRFFFEKQAAWMLQFKRLKNSESSDADLISFEEVDRDFRQLGGIFSNIKFDYGDIRWIGETVYVPFNVDIGGTKKSAVFAVGRKAAAANATIEGGSVDKDILYEIIDEREFYSRIETGGAARGTVAAAKLKDDLSKAVYSEHFRLHDASDAVRYLQKKSSDTNVNRVLEFILEHHVLKDAADTDPFTLSVSDIAKIVSNKYPSHPVTALLRALSPDQVDLIQYALRLPALTLNEMLFDTLEGESPALVRQSMKEMNRLRGVEGVQIDFTPDLARAVFADAKTRIYGLRGVGPLSGKTALFYEREILVRFVLEGVKRLGNCAMIVEAGASAGEGYYVNTDIKRTSDYDLEVIFEEDGLADKTAHLKKAKETIGRMIRGGTFSNGDKFEDLLTMYVFGDQVFKNPSALRGTSEWRILGSLPMLAPKLHLHYALWSNRVMYEKKGTTARVSDVGELAFDAGENRLEGHEYIAYQLEALSKAFLDGNTKPLIKLGLRSVLGAVVADDELLAEFRSENPRMATGSDGKYQYSEMIFNLAKKSGTLFTDGELELIEWLFYGKVGKNAGITENSREKIEAIERLIYKLFIMTQQEYPSVLAAIADPAEREMRRKAYLKKLDYIMEATQMRIAKAEEAKSAGLVREYNGYLDALAGVKQSILLRTLTAVKPQPAAAAAPQGIAAPAPALRDNGIFAPLWNGFSQWIFSSANALAGTIVRTGAVLRKELVSQIVAGSISYCLFFIPPYVDQVPQAAIELIEYTGRPLAGRVLRTDGIDEAYFKAVLASMDESQAAALFESVSALQLSEGLLREKRVINDLVRFEQKFNPALSAGACLKHKNVFSRYVTFLKHVEEQYPGFCADIQSGPSKKLDE